MERWLFDLFENGPTFSQIASKLDNIYLCLNCRKDKIKRKRPWMAIFVKRTLGPLKILFRFGFPLIMKSRRCVGRFMFHVVVVVVIVDVVVVVEGPIRRIRTEKMVAWLLWIKKLLEMKSKLNLIVSFPHQLL